ncbi:hypothetical protein [Spirilliplanes yamanashiensis]|uniref:Uncharacterized protein n=1 Tax=Spirilliplanes yamanashiensis TaxID=42233 RepID=A0A8J4DLA4_9ACTN|nr:hypothetical protein [Spirilliplanes yamanashiensis]MDP9816653.1 hypothetical protein [Spirilliplanes yamanashiensis]GIJ06177.1 hypothetical protein Sya03_55290 [Spirilliplanes yamanashiensis]
MTRHLDAEHIGALAGLMGWAEHRGRPAQERADLVAAAWGSGIRNVAELSRIARVSRDTIYADLRARGIDPSQRAEPVSPQQTGGTAAGAVSPDALRVLAKLLGAVAGPEAVAGASDGDMVRVVDSTATLLDLVADLLDPPLDQGPGWTGDDLLPQLVLHGGEVAGHARRTMAARATADDVTRLATWVRTGARYSGRALVVDRADVALRMPDGSTTTVTVTVDDAGATTLTGGGPALSGATTELDQLDLFQALTTLADVVGRHLDPSAHVARRRDDVPGVPPVRQRLLPSNDDRA